MQILRLPTWACSVTAAVVMQLGGPVDLAAQAKTPSPTTSGPTETDRRAAGQATGRPTAPADTTSLVSPEVRELLDDWMASLRGLRSLRVRFTQTKRLKILRRPRVSSGEARLLGKQLYLRTTDARGRVETEMHVDDGRVRIHYPRRKKLEVYAANRSTKTKPPFPLVTEDIESLPQDYRLSVEPGGKPGARTLVMRPRDAATNPIVEARIRFDGTRMTAVEQRNRRGDRVEMTIEAFDINADVKPAELQLTVPAGTTVLEVGGGGSAPQPKTAPTSRQSRRP